MEMGRFSMLNFVRKVFGAYLEVLLWINLILFVIIGGVIGSLLGGRHDDHTFAGIFIGAIIGMLGNILFGGLAATVVDTGRKVDKLSKGNLSLGEFIPTHRVKLLTGAEGMSLRKEPNSSSSSFAKILDGTNVQHINTGEKVNLNGIIAPWFEVRTIDGTQGWCFSGSLEEI